MHSLSFPHIELIMGNSGFHPHPLPHTPTVHTTNSRSRGQRVPTSVFHRYQFCRLACLFQRNLTTSTLTYHTIIYSTIIPRLSRRQATVHGQHEYHITFVLPRVRGRR